MLTMGEGDLGYDVPRPGQNGSDDDGEEGSGTSTGLSPAGVQSTSWREGADLHREVFVHTFFEVLSEVERAYADEIAQEPGPHRDVLRLELHASLHTLRTVLDLTGQRLAERLAVGSTTA